MRCYICDATLTPEGTHFSSDHESWDPCPTCLIAISEVFEDHLEEAEVTWLLEHEEEIGQVDDDFP